MRHPDVMTTNPAGEAQRLAVHPTRSMVSTLVESLPDVSLEFAVSFPGGRAVMLCGKSMVKKFTGGLIMKVRS